MTEPSPSIRSKAHCTPTTIRQGSVGLTAANMDQSGELLGDVLLHMDHYRKRSGAFAGRCAEYFNADQIVAQLLRAESTAQPLSQSLAHRLDLSTQPNAQSNAR